MQYFLSKLLTVLVFLIIFTVIVVSHEFGHFLIGRLNGIKIKEFAIGMGPVIFKKKLKSTILKIHLLPIGGACIFDSDEYLFDSEIKKLVNDVKADDSLTDEEKEIEINEIIKQYEAETDDEETKDLPGGKFSSASVWGRIATVLAGPFFNFITGYIFCLFIVWFCGQDLPVVYDVNEGYPAEEAGIMPGDTILSIDNQKIYLWREISLDSILSYGDPMKVKYERDGVVYDTVLYPKYSEESGRYYLGLVGGGEFIECNNLSVFKYTYCEIRFMVKSVYKSLAHITKKGKASVDDFAGPVGIANVVDNTIEEAKPYGSFVVILNIVNLIVLLSINLGIMNLLPFPAIDGGRLIFLLIELITGKKVPADKEGLVHLIGFVLLFIFMIVIFFNDISHIVKGFM